MPTGRVAKVPSREQERETAIRLYRETRLPVDEIGQMFGVSRTTVHNWLRSAGVPQRGAMGPRKMLEERSGLAVEGDSSGFQEPPTAALDRQQIIGLLLESQRQLSELQQSLARLEGAMTTLVSIATALTNR